MHLENQYDTIAKEYDSLFTDEQSIQENNMIASMLSSVKGSVLDIGCGTGLLLDLISVSENDYLGVDSSAEKAKQYRIADNKTSEFAKWDEDKLIRELRTMDIPTEMQPFFFEPIDQLLGFDMNFTPEVPDAPTGETIQEETENQEKQTAAFEQKIERAQEQLNQEATEYIELPCPHCGETIRIKK